MKRKANEAPPQRFAIQTYVNPRTGTDSWRVTGTKRDGTRVRQNFSSQHRAQCKQAELEAEFLARHTETTLRSTRLTDTQVHIAENCFSLVDDDSQVLVALNHWLRHGRPQVNGDAPKLDEAVKQFRTWLDETPTLRHKSKINLRTRALVFANSSPNVIVSEIDADFIEAYLAKRKKPDGSPLDAVTRDNDRRAVGRFFSWCMERPRRWTTVNPCASVKVERGEKAAPEVLTVATCKKLMQEARKADKGALVPYLAVCLFGGLRPYEAQRLTWKSVNLADKEIHLLASQTKTKRSRTIHIDDTLMAWLTAYKNKPFHASNHRKIFRRLLVKVGYGTASKEHPALKPYPQDALRHTAISHYFRKVQSYGATAERFGNSEAIIKAHYQGRVSTKEMEAFYAIMPTKKGGRK